MYNTFKDNLKIIFYYCKLLLLNKKSGFIFYDKTAFA
jgi:hypothetical protein